MRRSPRKTAKVADCIEQQDAAEQDLFETDESIQLDDSPVDFEKARVVVIMHIRPMTFMILKNLSLKD